MSKTKTGIIGLVVLIVILIGGYSILTHSGENGLVTENNATSTATGTDMMPGTSTATSSTGMDESVATGDTGNGTTNGDTDGVTSGATENTGTGGNTSGNNGDHFGVGGDEEGTPADTSNTGSYQASSVGYANSDEGIMLQYPQTWNINEDTDPDSGDLAVTMGQSFAGGMKAEMDVTVYDNATIVSDDGDNNGDDGTFTVAGTDTFGVTAGSKYEVKLECKGEDLDCAGKSYLIPVSGHMEKDGWHGKVVKVSYGVFQTPNYHGPDTGVSPHELFNVAQSVFQGVANSVSISGLSGGSMMT